MCGMLYYSDKTTEFCCTSDEVKKDKIHAMISTSVMYNPSTGGEDYEVIHNSYNRTH